ncbi:MAG: 3-isopropylmalate dehydrogenase [Deltaproteobacteria bacterium]|jgi:3-isopropylmalate dehydrogenase|nr:3-isopropylmalate dehydrogenase [Deltaproteobacteria bacterium]MBK9369126.1 3-isopropylmalate dehydrogenase [Deltaproteobacteria bacterium]
MPHVAVIPGDGIGREVLDEGLKVLRALDARHGLNLRFTHLPYGADRYLATGLTITPEEMSGLRDYDAVYLGALGDPRVPSNVHAKDILLGMRFQLDLYINLRPCVLLDERYCPLKDRRPEDVRFTVFRENTEGLYTGIGGQFKRDTADEVAIEAELNTRKGVERIIRAAFEHARARGLGRVCMSDKSNAMRHGHDLWQRVFKSVAAEYPEIKASHLYVDALVMEMVRAPDRFDVIVTNNLFGDIVTDLGAQIQGGIGLAASGNLNPGAGIGMFEPVHGSAPDIAGQGLANPLAAVLSAGMMLSWLGHVELERQIEDAVRVALNDGLVTRELGGNLSTSQVGDAIVAILSR